MPRGLDGQNNVFEAWNNGIAKKLATSHPCVWEQLLTDSNYCEHFWL